MDVETALVVALKDQAFWDTKLGYCWCASIAWGGAHSSLCQEAQAAVSASSAKDAPGYLEREWMAKQAAS